MPSELAYSGPPSTMLDCMERSAVRQRYSSNRTSRTLSLSQGSQPPGSYSQTLCGCYPTDLRLLEHKELDRKLTLISRLTKARFGIVDVLYGLDVHGPMEGEARALGKFIASNDLVVLDIACATMMGFNPEKVLHLRNLLEFAGGTRKLPTFESNEDLTSYKWDFRLGRNVIDSLSFACFHSDLLAKVVFDSPFTTPIYSVLGRKPRRKLT